MSSRSSARPCRLLAAVATATMLTAALPALAQTNAGNAAGSPSAETGPSQPTASAPATSNNAGNTMPGNGNRNQVKHTTPPSQKLPEPKPSDYGASNFNAPNDAQLDHFAATHQPPNDNNGTGQSKASNNSTTTEASGTPDAIAPTAGAHAASPSNSAERPPNAASDTSD